MPYVGTYNQYLTKGINNGSIPHREVDGVKVYQVRKPRGIHGCDNCNFDWSCLDASQGGRCTFPEEVVGYTNFSDIFGKETITERAEREGKASLDVDTDG